jgi:predicted nucleotidyltransferase
MRTSSLADSLFPKTRQIILATTLLNPDRSWYIRDLARHLAVQASTLQRELARLAMTGVLRSWQDGKRVYFQADKSCPIFQELRSVVIKTVGLADALRDALKSLKDRITTAFIFGSIADGKEKTASDVDLMVVGSIGMRDVAPILTSVTEKLCREVNSVIYTPNEFARKARESGFVKTVLGRPLLFVIGTKDDLEGIAGAREGRKGIHRQKRD